MTNADYRAHHYAQVPAPSVQQKRPMSVWARVVLALLGAALLAGCLAGIAGALSSISDQGASSGALVATTTQPGQPAGAAPSRRAAPLQPRDITITLKTTDKECFGSAGCSVTVTPRLGWPVGQDPDGAYDVTYVITYKTIDFDGGGSHVTTEQTVGTARILGDGDQYESDQHILMTASRSTKITVRVDQVERRP